MNDESTSIALFLPSLRGGGAERVMINLAKGFAEHGKKVDLVLAKAEGPYLSQVPAGVKVVDLKSKRVLVSLPGLVRYLRRERPSVLLCTLDHANIVALWARKFAVLPSRVVVRVANNLSQVVDNSPIKWGSLMVRLIRWFYPWADAIVVVSKGAAEALAKATGLPLERIKVIYNPVVIPEVLEKAKEPLNHPWFTSGQPPVILSVGRLTKQKDYPTLIQAFARVRKKLPVRLMILGEGEDRSNLDSMIRDLGLEDDVLLPGFVDNPYAYMAQSAVFVLSSAWEGFGNVIAEAMALGTPIVSTDCPSGPAEILEKGRWGKLTPVGDNAALAAAIIDTLKEGCKDPKALQDRAKTFALDNIVKEYMEVLNIV